MASWQGNLTSPGANWQGNVPLVSKYQLLSTSAGLYDDLKDFNFSDNFSFNFNSSTMDFYNNIICLRFTSTKY